MPWGLLCLPAPGAEGCKRHPIRRPPKNARASRKSSKSTPASPGRCGCQFGTQMAQEGAWLTSRESGRLTLTGCRDRYACVQKKTGPGQTRNPPPLSFSIMTHLENLSATGRVPVSAAVAPCPPSIESGPPPDPAPGGPCSSLTGFPLPRTSGPSDVWHSEGYLIACLMRHHGWVCLEPGTLVRWEAVS